jgi:hypothetical protein
MIPKRGNPVFRRREGRFGGPEKIVLKRLERISTESDHIRR